MTVTTKKMKFGTRVVTIATKAETNRWAMIYTEKVDDQVLWCVGYYRHEPDPKAKGKEYFDIDSKKFVSVATDHDTEKEAKAAAADWLKNERVPEVDPPITPTDIV